MSSYSQMTPPARQQEWTTDDTPRISFDDASLSDYSPSMASVHTAVVVGRDQPMWRTTSPSLQQVDSPILPPSPFLSAPPTFTSPFSHDGALLSPKEMAYADADSDEEEGGSGGSSSADETRLSTYGPKMTLVSLPPWEADETITRPSNDSSRRSSGGPTRSPTSFSFGSFTGSRRDTPPKLASPSKTGGVLRGFVQSRPVEPFVEPDMSFLDLADNKRSPSSPKKRLSIDRAQARKGSLGNVIASPWARPTGPLPHLPPQANKAGRPRMPSIVSSTSMASSSSAGQLEERISTPSTSLDSLSHYAMAPPSAPPTMSSFGLISLEAARGREQRARSASRPTPSPFAEPQQGQPKLKAKRSGFLRLFNKKPDEEGPQFASVAVPSLPTPPLSIGNSSPESPRFPHSSRGSFSSPVEEARLPSPPPPPPSRPPPAVTFSAATNAASSTTPRYRERGLAPSLSLRPVSMAFSNAIPSAYLDPTSGSTTPLEPPPTSPYTPGTPSLRSASGSSFTSTGSALPDVEDQIAAAKAAWQRQLGGLEEQVRTLQAEVEALRSEGGGGGQHSGKSAWKACEACGCMCAVKRSAASVVHRQRQKVEGEGERGSLFASRHQ